MRIYPIEKQNSISLASLHLGTAVAISAVSVPAQPQAQEKMYA